MGGFLGGQLLTVGIAYHAQAAHALPAIGAKTISRARPTSPHRCSRQHLERPGVQWLPLGCAVLATVDALGNLVELASVRQGAEALG